MRPLILTNVIAYIINFFGGVFTQEERLPAGRPRYQSVTEGRLGITIRDTTGATSQRKPTKVSLECRTPVTPPDRHQHHHHQHHLPPQLTGSSHCAVDVATRP